MMKKLDNSKHLGMFTIEPDRQVFGELTLAGWKTSLCLWDKDYFGGWERSPLSINGILHDLTKVSLSDCVTREGPSQRYGNGEVHYYKLFPHYAVFGNQHISFEAKTITEVSFAIDDATILFHDFDSFGRVIDARPLIEQIVDNKRDDHDIKTGESPIIAYFTGKREIVVTDTVLGKVIVSHNPSYSLGGPVTFPRIQVQVESEELITRTTSCPCKLCPGAMARLSRVCTSITVQARNLLPSAS